jgi:hypothetical protein
MPAKGDRVRDTNGKFSTKRKLQWKENLKNACKRRKIQNEDSKESIVDGRRVVEIKMLAEEMWCPACDAPLSFRYVEDENVIGLASIFRVRCHTCLLLHEVRSSKCYKKREDGNCTQYDVNAKSALGKKLKNLVCALLFTLEIMF